MSFPEVDPIFAMEEDDIQTFVLNAGFLATGVFGAANPGCLVSRAEVLRSDGTYAQVSRQLTVEEGLIIGEDVKGVLLEDPHEISVDPEDEEDGVVRAWKGRCFEFGAFVENSRIEVTRGVGTVSLDCEGVVVFEVDEYDEDHDAVSPDEPNIPQLTDLFSLQRVVSLFQK